MNGKALVAAVALIGVVGCGETTRNVGSLPSGAGQAGEGSDSGGAAQPGASGDAGAPPAACSPFERCGGSLLRADTDTTGRTEWVATAASACQDLVPDAPPEPRDACDRLSVNVDGSVRYNAEIPALPLVAAWLRLRAAGEQDRASQFDASVLGSGRQAIFFTAECRAGWSAGLSCPELAPRLAEASAPDAKIFSVRCLEDAAGGCDCEYQLKVLTRTTTPWQALDGVLSPIDEGVQPAPLDYCAQGESLALSQHGQQPLLSPFEGLRTLVLHPPTCDDGVEDGDEAGIDCGGRCGGTCATCNNGVRDPSEAGVDCGDGSYLDYVTPRGCPDFCTCFNGAQDAWEEGLDCGGPCSLPCSCTNQRRDPGENGIDCGGPCQMRFAEPVPVACPGP